MHQTMDGINLPYCHQLVCLGVGDLHHDLLMFMTIQSLLGINGVKMLRYMNMMQRVRNGST